MDVDVDVNVRENDSTTERSASDHSVENQGFSMEEQSRAELVEREQQGRVT
jgi:hypothetical protein